VKSLARGRNVKRITQETGATIDIREDGVAFVKGLTDESVNMAKQQVEMIVKDPKWVKNLPLGWYVLPRPMP